MIFEVDTTSLVNAQMSFAKGYQYAQYADVVFAAEELLRRKNVCNECHQGAVCSINGNTCEVVEVNVIAGR